MKKSTKNLLIGAGVLGVGYLLFRAIKAVNTPEIIPAPTVDVDAEVIETTINPRSKTPKAYTSRPHLDPLKDFPMKFGSKGYEVGLLQAKAGMPEIEQDGIWGVKTEEAIKRVFARNNFSLSQYNDAISSQVFGGKTFVDVAKEAQAQAQAQTTRLTDMFNPLKGK
jgi:hypothetical protein